MGILSTRAASRGSLGANATLQLADPSEWRSKRQPARVRREGSTARRDQIDRGLLARADRERRERCAGRRDLAEELVGRRRPDVVAAALLATLAYALYSYRAQTPAQSTIEQPLHAAVDLLRSHGGHDDGGRWLPLFVQISPELWLPPVPVYS